MSRSSRYVLLLAWCAPACSGVVDQPGGKQGGDAGAGSAATSVGSGGAAGNVGSGQGITSSSNGGSNGQSGAQGVGGSTGAAGEGHPFIPDSGEAATPKDAGPGAMDVVVGESGITDGSFDDSGQLGPIVPPDCPGDPTAGWTEYSEAFKIQLPYDLMESDRYNFIDGLYTFWVFPNDKPFEVGNTTAPRTEARYPNMTAGEKMWSGDVLVDSPSNTTTIFQVHHTTTGAGPVYLQVNGGNVRELDGQLIVSNIIGKWFNLKVAFDPATANATIYVNNCQKLMLRNSRPGDHVYYFKHGVYTCTSSVCRDHYKNVHTYQR